MDESGADVPVGISEIPTIKEDDVSDPVLEKFQKGELLIHVVDTPGIQKGLNGPEIDFSSWKYKLDHMKSDQGMENTSTTLITEGVPIELYVRPIGFIFDATGVEINDVALRDSGSGTNKTEMKSLDELRNHYGDDSSHTHGYNEVVATVKKADVLALVIRKGVRSPSTLSGLAAVKKFIKSTEDLDLTVYEYDEHDGSLKLFETPDRQQLLYGLSGTYRSAYENAI